MMAAQARDDLPASERFGMWLCSPASLRRVTAELRRLPPIPKRIFVTWREPFNVRASTNPMIALGLGRLLARNPGWALELAGDAQVDAYLQATLA
jgi:hypothetical protein